MTQHHSHIKLIGSRLNRLEEALLAILLFSMMSLACLQIILRDVFSTGFVWADPLLRYMVLWTGLIGADVATRRGKHITIDIISHLIPRKIEPWLTTVMHLFSLLVCFFLTYAAFVFIRNEAAFGGGRTILGMPVWAMNLIFPLAFGLMTFRFTELFYSNLLNIAKNINRSKADTP